MNNNEELLKLISEKESEPLNIKAFFFRYIKYWHWFIIAGSIGLTSAFLYNRYAPPSYSANSLVFVKEKGNEGVNLNDLFDSFQLKSDVKLENHIGILTSFSLNKQVVENLGWRTSWFKPMPFGDHVLYGNEPFNIYLNNEAMNIPNFKVFIRKETAETFRVLANGQSIYEGEEIEININKEVNFGEKFQSKYFNFTLEDKGLEDSNDDFYFIVNDISLMALSYVEKLDVSSVNKNADLIRLQLEGQSPKMEIAYLNELMKVYVDFGLKEKNLTAENTIHFIDWQLGEILDTLKITEKSFTNYRSENNVFDLEEKARLVLDKLVQLDSRKSLATMQLKYYENLIRYLDNGEKMNEMIAPSVVGITDVGLNNLIVKLNELYTQKEALSYSLQDKNPSLQLIDRELAYTLRSLSENLRNLVNNSKTELQSIQKEIDSVNKELKNYPQAEQDLIGIKRMFDLNNELYTFLLQKRAEAEITKASNIADVKVLDSANYSTIKKLGPRKGMNYIIGLIMGLIVPFLVVYLKDIFDDTIHTKEELEKMTSIPVVGSIIHNNMDLDIPIVEYPRSVFAETVRTLRTNIEYIYREKGPIVIGLHSIVPGEGKSFVSLNLSVAISLNNKKVILIGGDMRKPTLHKMLKVDNDKGLSTYLVGHYEKEEIIKKTTISGLDFIPSGVIPPNPAELLATERFKKLIEQLKSTYDAVIVDNSPINLVTDAAIVKKYTNVDLFVVRQGYSHKELIGIINNLTENNKERKAGIILNDIRSSKYYGAYNYQHVGYYKKYYGGGGDGYFENVKKA